MVKRIIFHLPVKPDLKQMSASNIRPQKMLKAFQDLGYEVDVVMGTAKERSLSIKRIKEKIRAGFTYDFMYSESSTMPTLLTEEHHLPIHPTLDFGFFFFCKRNGIKIGLFYRDVYWKFKEYREEVGTFKYFFSSKFYKLDLLVYKKVLDVLFLPSKYMAKLVTEAGNLKIISLPSGTDEKFNLLPSRVSNNRKLNILYVGGLGEFYNLSMFVKGVAERCHDTTLTICCREGEWEKVKGKYLPYLRAGNVIITHKTGLDLEQLYSKTQICCLFLEPHSYRNFAMPMKIFEYISFGKPIVTVDQTAAGEFVHDNHVGWVLPYDFNSLRLWFNNIVANEGEVLLKSSRALDVADKQTWKHRAAEVAQALST